MFHRELTASDLNDAVLLDLLRIEDPLGVLSVFVEMPADGADRRPEIEIKNRLTNLARRAGGNGSVLRAEALRSTLALVAPALERLLDPRASGRGGAVFAALSGPEVISLATPMPLASRVVLDARPFIRPLLELLDEGEPAGVVLTSAREAEVLDWRLGALRCLQRVTRQPAEEHAQTRTLREQRVRRGAIAPEGSLLAAGEAPGLGTEEPRLLERILERAFHTGARITPVDGSAADNLADAGGIAALLR